MSTFFNIKMRKLLPLLLVAAASTSFAQCQTDRQEQGNSDGSSIRLIQRQCNEIDQRTIHVQLKPARAAAYVTVLKRIQSAEETSVGGGRLRDVDGDGIFEYEEIGTCGAGPNCEGKVFKARKDRRGMYLFFEGGYADFKYIPNFYIESGRASCCSWEHHIYREPSGERGITENDFVYSITVGGFSARKTSAIPCFISKKRNGKWISHATRNKHLLALCELYGPDYVVNPPGMDEEQ